MSTRCDLARRAPRPSPTTSPGLTAPKVTVCIGGERRAVDRAGVGVDAAGDVDGDGQRRRPAGRGRASCRGVGPQPAARRRCRRIPSSTRSARPTARRRRRPPATRPPGRRAARPSPAACARSGSSRTAVTRAPRRGQQRRRRTARRRRCCRCRRAARPARRTTAPSSRSADGGQAGGGPLHERALGRWPAQQRLLGGADLARAVNSPITAAPRAAALGDHHGRGDAAVVAERDVPGGDAELGGPAGDRAAHLEVRPAVLADGHLGVVPEQVAGRAERLGQRLLGREPRGQGLAGARMPDGVSCSAAVNSRSAQPGRAGQRRGEPLDRHDVDARPR